MSELSSSVLLLVVTKIQVHIFWNSWGSLSFKSLLQIAVNAKIIENRQKTQSTQFVIKFENFNIDVWTVKFSPHILWNSWGSLILKNLLQNAANVKIIETRQ